MRKILFLVAVAAVLATTSSFGQAPAFSQVVVFGDSLSDTGNVRARTSAKSSGAIDYPSHTFNYDNGRFTNDTDTDPASHTYLGVWHEQLARTFLGLPAASNSLGGGVNYAFGGATTMNGTYEEVLKTPVADITITIDDMGKQMDDYFSNHVFDPNALFIEEVMGGDELTLRFNNPRSDSRTPDIIVQPVYGTIYTSSTKKNAEHGGFSFADSNVALIVSNPDLPAKLLKTPVSTSQVAPTIVRALGIPPLYVEGVLIVFIILLGIQFAWNFFTQPTGE